ncbi:type I-MYXAN CRISPR-associated protein Cas6/Cmx6 [Chamaesiphon sp. OTE_75_metabat_556]|uniref:type I-MYXAN CRISPR-associated protein Cas6/Cmx6 n=1 Tax=Chamaesiphon sp. OTE_75_metabat_556 TaxID=2964692 RepID=UPI00286D1370|nr:type I-MYXAN CRISPR-associated protein Cas6/Cmx6 [Chamaesiphon sp. OTE_75_metabat_556]
MNYLEIQYKLVGKTLPADHGYALYSVVKKLVLDRKDTYGELLIDRSLPPETLISSISGVPDRDGTIFLNRYSRLRLRCPNDNVQLWYRLLQEQLFDIQGHLIRLVQPQLTLPEPSESLKARLVTFKLKEWNQCEAPTQFLISCQRALDKLEIQAKPFIDSDRSGDLAKRSLYIHGKHVMGYGVVIEGLKPEDSIKLQCLGMGGRKHFGCGWFYPSQELANAA